MAGGFFTVGHSTRTFAEFVEILQHAGVQLVVDVRTFPRSRTNPAFNIDTMPDALRPYQIAYCHSPDLGGRRPVQHDIPKSVNARWRNSSFHNYADYALSVPFGQALAELVAFGQHKRLAVMCSEAVWWRCHRRIITDYLLLNGRGVTHLMGGGREDPASPTPGAVRRGDGKVVYPEEAAA